MNKIGVNHLEKLFVTNDVVTILRELELQHSAGEMIIMASPGQELENQFILVFAGVFPN